MPPPRAPSLPKLRQSNRRRRSKPRGIGQGVCKELKFLSFRIFTLLFISKISPKNLIKFFICSSLLHFPCFCSPICAPKYSKKINFSKYKYLRYKYCHTLETLNQINWALNSYIVLYAMCFPLTGPPRPLVAAVGLAAPVARTVWADNLQFRPKGRRPQSSSPPPTEGGH